MENKIEQQDQIDNKTDDTVIVVEELAEKKPSNKLVWLALAVLLLACLALFGMLNQQKSANDNLNKQLVSMETGLLDSSQVQTLIDSAISDLSIDLQVEASTVVLQQKQLAEDMALLKSRLQLSGADVQYSWALAEVEYLLNIANQQALFLDDAKGAYRALSLADEQIESLSDYRLHPLRALLAEEQESLRTVVKVDVEGMALQLQSALDHIDSLHVVMGPEMIEAGDLTTPASDDWTTTYHQVWQEVKSLVVIRQQQDGAAAVLVPEQRYFLYQNLRLKLEAAHFALLSGKTAAFESSLNSAQQWLAHYFVGDERDALSTSLAELQAVSMQVEMPDISASLRWLKGFEQ